MQAGNITLEIKDIKNNPKGTMDLPKEVFASSASEATVHTYVVSFLANQRQGTHATKTRGLVSGGGKKPMQGTNDQKAVYGEIYFQGKHSEKIFSINKL